MGIVGHDDDITDYSPDGVAARADAARAALRELDGVTPEDDVDVVTSPRCANDSVVQIELHDARTGCRRTERDRVAAAVDARRVRSDGHRDRRGLGADRAPDVAGARPGRGLRRGTARGGGGRASARGPAGRAWHRAGGPDPAAVRRHGGRRGVRTTMRCMPSLQQRASAAADAYGTLAAVLRDEIGTARPRRGRVRARRLPVAVASSILGAAVDLDETYEWGLRATGKHCRRTGIDRQPALSRRRRSAEALRRLDDEPRYLVHGTDALQSWMQDLSDRAVDALADTHFEIAEPLRTPGVPDRADPDRRHLLHRPVGGPQPARADVVVGAAGRRRISHLAGDHHRLPRGRAGTSPPDRPGGRARPTG